MLVKGRLWEFFKIVVANRGVRVQLMLIWLNGIIEVILNNNCMI